jgi:hypothetical protein
MVRVHVVISHFSSQQTKFTNLRKTHQQRYVDRYILRSLQRESHHGLPTHACWLQNNVNLQKWSTITKFQIYGCR